MELYTGYEPHARQRPFHNSKAKFRALITGVGFGKSASGANELIKTAIEYPKALHLILAPTSKIMQYATLNQFYKFCPKELIKQHLKSKNIFYLKGGARIIYLTADNERHIDRLRGIEIGSYWVDEPRLMPGYIHPILITRLRDKYGPLRGWYTTTPKGFDWNYFLFAKKMDPMTKEKMSNPEDYEYFTGSSLDNPYTPKEWKENLKAQLKGKFGRQEIYGDFVGFEGQVYDNFKPDIHLIDWKQAKIDKMIKDKFFKQFIIGLDFGFTNATAALVIGLDNDNRAYILEEFYQKRASEDMLSDWLFKQKEKYECPDALIYADPSNPAYIDKLCGMGHSITKADNEVMPGIHDVYSRFEVAGDKKPRIYISLRCSNLVDEVNSYRYADKKIEKDEKEEPLKINDHACFVKGTKIITINGEISIEKIKPGDYVLTRKGWKRVDLAEVTNYKSEVYEVQMNDRKLVCTGNHPFWIKGKGWKSADSLRYFYKVVDSLRYLWQTIILKEGAITKAQMDTGEEQVDFTTYIEIFGKKYMAKSQKNTMSIIKMAIKIIMKYQTLNVSHVKNITKDIQKQKNRLKKIKNILKELDPLLKNGMEVKKELNGTLNIGKIQSEKYLRKKNISVNNAGSILFQELFRELNSVIQTANKKTYVVGVKKLKKKQRVYNLAVEGCHEYFANGVLVSNCDALRYALRSYDSGMGTYQLLTDPEGSIF